MEPLFHNDIVESNRIIYTPSDFAKSSLFHLQETGVLQAKHPHTSTRQNLASYLFFVVESGSGTLEYEGVTYPLESGDCVFIDCCRSYSHTTQDDLWRIRWVHFYGPNMGEVYEKYQDRGGKPCYSTDRIESYQEALEQIYTVAKASSYVRDMKIHEKLSSLLVLLMEDGWNPERKEQAAGKQSSIQRVKAYLDENFTQKISLDDLGGMFYINKFYLLEIFKQQYGTTISEYLIRKRITKSKQLLRFSDLTVEEIAYQCGMNSPHYFSRMFKKIEGTSPSGYRKSWLSGKERK